MGRSLKKQFGLIGQLYLLWIVPLVLLPTLILQEKVVKHRLNFELDELTSTTVDILTIWADRPVSRLSPATCVLLTPGFFSYSENTNNQFLSDLNFTSMNAFDKNIITHFNVELTLFEVLPPTVPMSLDFKEEFLMQFNLRNKWAHLFIDHLKNNHVIDNKVDISSTMNVDFTYKNRFFNLSRNVDSIKITSTISNTSNNYTTFPSSTKALYTMSYININNQFITGDDSQALVNPCDII